MSGLLEATAVRVGFRVLLIPAGHEIPEGAVVYGPAKPERVYELFYEATHCRHGHERAERERLHRNGRSKCSGCNRAYPLPSEWPWGAPALA